MAFELPLGGSGTKRAARLAFAPVRSRSAAQFVVPTCCCDLMFGARAPSIYMPRRPNPRAAFSAAPNSLLPPPNAIACPGAMRAPRGAPFRSQGFARPAGQPVLAAGWPAAIPPVLRVKGTQALNDCTAPDFLRAPSPCLSAAQGSPCAAPLFPLLGSLSKPLRLGLHRFPFPRFQVATGQPGRAQLRAKGLLASHTPRTAAPPAGGAAAAISISQSHA
ncbi:MAG: hypothetical protein J3K34DRAFT_95502 [Monoraphidium minutum]|nr:MAG: hypothetical protein J3K34DRAFT_95502 [Monoraphidium minutum]